MERLIKVQRMDRNGRLVHKWMKPEMTKRKSLAAFPTVAPDTGTIALVHGVRDTAENVMMLHRDGLDKAISDHVPHGQLARLHELLLHSEHRFELAQYLIMAVENPKHGKALIPRLIAHVDDLPAGVPVIDAVNIMVGLDDYGRGFSVEQERALIQTTYAATRAGVSITLCSGKRALSGYRLGSHDLMEFVASRPHDAPAITEIITGHRTGEPWKIDQLLDGSLPSSIASGAL